MTDLNREFARAYKASKQRQDEFAEISKRVKFITRIANKYVARRVSLLDVCCGNGMLVKSLEKRYACVGIDIDAAAIRNASKTAKEVEFYVADMLDMHLDRTFDILTCFDAIDHGDELRRNIGKILKDFYFHLNKGGTLIFSAPMSLELWENEQSTATTFAHKGKRWAYLYRRHIRTDGSFRYEKIIVSIDGDRIRHDFRSFSYKVAEPLLKASRISSIAEKVGFKVHVYAGLSGRRWTASSTEGPVFVCTK